MNWHPMEGSFAQVAILRDQERIRFSGECSNGRHACSGCDCECHEEKA